MWGKREKRGGGLFLPTGRGAMEVAGKGVGGIKYVLLTKFILPHPQEGNKFSSI